MIGEMLHDGVCHVFAEDRDLVDEPVPLVTAVKRPPGGYEVEVRAVALTAVAT